MLHRFFSLVLRIRNPDPLDPQHSRVWIRILIDPQKKFYIALYQNIGLDKNKKTANQNL